MLLPRALVARDALPAALRAAGAEVNVVAAYRSLPPDAAAVQQLREWIGASALDASTLKSRSTVDNKVAPPDPHTHTLTAGLTLAAIGPITAETAQQHGLQVAVSARPYTSEALVAALERHYQELS